MKTSNKKTIAKPIGYIETQKFNLWVKYFTDNSNKHTFGNGTQSAIAAYGYTFPEQYHLASVTGSKNMRKYEYLGISILDKIGFSYGELMKIGIKKALDGSYQDWDTFMERLGYFEGKRAIQQYNQFNVTNMGEAIRQARIERGLDV